MKGLGGEGKISPHPCVKLVGIMPETSNLVHKYTHLCSFGKYTFYYLLLINFPDGSIIITFWQKKYFYSKEQCES